MNTAIPIHYDRLMTCVNVFSSQCCQVKIGPFISIDISRFLGAQPIHIMSVIQMDSNHQRDASRRTNELDVDIAAQTRAEMQTDMSSSPQKETPLLAGFVPIEAARSAEAPGGESSKDGIVNSSDIYLHHPQQQLEDKETSVRRVTTPDLTFEQRCSGLIILYDIEIWHEKNI